MTYHIPIGNFGSGNMLDSNMFAITIANTGIDGTKSAFAQDLTHSVGPFERFAISLGTFFQTCKVQKVDLLIEVTQSVDKVWTA